MARGSRAQASTSHGNDSEEDWDGTQDVPLQQNIPLNRDHRFLKFKGDDRDKYRSAVNELTAKVFSNGRVINWGYLDRIQLADRNATVGSAARSFFVIHHQGFQSNAWLNFMGIQETVYSELTIEFCATFHFTVGTTDMNKRTAVEFRLGGVRRKMSVIELAELLGLYTEQDTRHPGFQSYIDYGHKRKPDHYHENEFWVTIAKGQYRASSARETLVRNPIHRLLHRCISLSLTARKTSPERISSDDLFFMYSLISDNSHICLPYYIARMFIKAGGRGPTSGICIGRFVTRIAQSLGVLTTVVIRGLTTEYPVMDTDENYFISHGFLEKTGGVVHIGKTHRDAEEEEEEEEEGGEEEEEGGHQTPPPPQHFQFGPGPYPWDSQFDRIFSYQETSQARFDSIDQQLSNISLNQESYRKDVQGYRDEVQSYREEVESYRYEVEDYSRNVREYSSRLDVYEESQNTMQRSIDSFLSYMPPPQDPSGASSSQQPPSEPYYPWGHPFYRPPGHQ